VDRLRELDPVTVRRAIAGLIAATVLVVLAIVIFGGDDDSGGGSSGEAVALSESELLEKSGTLGHPTYWVGPRPGTTSYELTTTPDGRNYIRYLTGDAEAGDPLPSFLTVGTYSVPNAKQALQKAIEGGEGKVKVSHHDGYEVLAGGSGANAYVVFDDQPDLQIEVFSPRPGEALKLANSGALIPLG
jgi:hypothetical protein